MQFEAALLKNNYNKAICWLFSLLSPLTMPSNYYAFVVYSPLIIHHSCISIYFATADSTLFFLSCTQLHLVFQVLCLNFKSFMAFFTIICESMLVSACAYIWQHEEFFQFLHFFISFRKYLLVSMQYRHFIFFICSRRRLITNSETKIYCGIRW